MAARWALASSDSISLVVRPVPPFWGNACAIQPCTGCTNRRTWDSLLESWYVHLKKRSTPSQHSTLMRGPVYSNWPVVSLTLCSSRQEKIPSSSFSSTDFPRLAIIFADCILFYMLVVVCLTDAGPRSGPADHDGARTP